MVLTAGRRKNYGFVIQGEHRPVTRVRGWGRWECRPFASTAQSVRGESILMRAHGTTAPRRDRMPDFDGINEVIGTEALMAEAQLYE
jgi:hypothetical protein